MLEHDDTPRAPRRQARFTFTFTFAVALLGAAPFVLVAHASKVAADVAARRAAAWLMHQLRSVEPTVVVAAAAVDAPSEAPPPTPPVCCDGEARQASAQPQRKHVARRTGAPVAALPAQRVPRVIQVGPDAVSRAVPPAGRPSAAWVEPTSASPAGVRFGAVGALGAFVRVGDILVEAEGRRLHDVAELITIVGNAYQRRSKTVVGRLWRSGELWSVVVEPGW